MHCRRPLSRISGGSMSFVHRPGGKQTVHRERFPRSALSIAFVTLLVLAAAPSHLTLATTTVTVSPSSWTFGDRDAVVFIQADAAAPANQLTFDIHIDVDGDGVLDPEDGRFMSFTIADGQQPHLGNEYYWHDQDGHTNSSVTATLTAFGDWGEWLFAGDFILAVTDEDASGATAAFSVNQDASYPCVVTGSVQMGGAAVRGAIVMVMDMVADEDAAMGMTGEEGTFELRVEFPGEYGVYAMRMGALTQFAEGSGQIVELSEGANPLPQPLVVFPGERTISGRVFASDSGEGFPGLLVFGEAEEAFSLAVTDDAGDYNLAVVDGEWERVGLAENQMSRLGYLPAPGRSVTVSGSDVSGIGLMCQRATTLVTGTVKDGETQELLPGIALYAEEANDGGDEGREAVSYTLEDGVYKIGVTEGEWWVNVEENRLVGTGYAPPPWQLITAPASGTVSDINFILREAGTISGHVYEDDDATPVEEAWVQAFEFGTWNWVAGTETLPDGSYTLSVPSGTYRVMVSGVEGWLDQHYLNVWNWEDATPVEVLAPGETSGINFVLVPAAYITGHVYEADETTPVEGAQVEASFFGPSWQWAASDQTEADGSYSLTVPTGTYMILVRDVPGRLSQFYDRVRSDTDATPVSATGGEVTSGIDFVLELAATISGHVYEDDGITPLSGAWVSAIDVATEEWWGGPFTGDDGSYFISVPAGRYKIWADADGWVGEYYDDTYRFNDASVITVVPPEEEPGIDFALTEATATIRGHVYQQDGATPLVGASVTALVYATDDAVGWAQSGADGSYTLPVPPGTFRVNAWAHHYSVEYYDHRQYHDATRVTLSGSQVVENIDFSLQWIPLVIWEVRQSTSFQGGADVEWWWVPGMTYSIYWTDALSAAGTTWHEVPDPWPDIVQEGDNGGFMTWTDKGTAPGMTGAPGDPRVRQRFYRVKEQPE